LTAEELATIKQHYTPSLCDADVVVAIREAADEDAKAAERVGAPGSIIREKYATKATMLYAAAARLESLLAAAAGGDE
jgi:hypothetical protein